MPLNAEELAAYQEKDRLFRELTEKAKWNICAVCNGRLNVAWLKGEYKLICGTDRNHIGIKSCREDPTRKGFV